MQGTGAGKVWGITECVIVTPFFEVHRIEVNPYCKCSLHCHEHKYNMFVVEQGKLIVYVHKNDYPLIDKTTVPENARMVVAPGEYHQFEAGPEGAIAYEIYWIEALDPNDIVRKSCGERYETKTKVSEK